VISTKNIGRLAVILALVLLAVWLAVAATAGTWHGAVFRSGSSPPSDYNSAAGATGYVTADSFYVTDNAIPEFSTIMAAISVAIICFGTYYWMRKKKVRHAQA